MTEKNANAFFIESGTLVPLKSNRVYTPEKMRRGIANLTQVLERGGYEQAKATVTHLETDDKTGAVKARISVHKVK